jgi:hypothetical protein
VLPNVGGAGGTVTYAAYVAQKNPTMVTYTTTLGAAPGAPAPYFSRRGNAAPSIVFTEQISMSGIVTFGATPGFALTLPTGSSNAGPFTLEVFDQTTNHFIAGEAAQAVSGNTVSFAEMPQTFQIVPNHTYTFELVDNAGPLPSPTQKPTPMPTPTVTPPPTPPPTPTPSPTPTTAPTPHPCERTEPDPHKAGVLLTGDPENVKVPCIGDFAGELGLPENNGGGSSPLTLFLASSPDKSLGAPPSKVGKAIFYTSLEANGELIFSTPDLGYDIEGHRQILDGDTYAVNVFANGKMLDPTIHNLKPASGRLMFTVVIPTRHLHYRERVQVVIYRTS